MRKLLKRYAFPERLVTDDLRSYGSAARELGLEHRRERGRWKNNRAENSHQPKGSAVAASSGSHKPNAANNVQKVMKITISDPTVQNVARMS